MGYSIDYYEPQHALEYQIPEYQINEELLYSEGAIDIEPFSQVWSMGQRIFVSGLGHYTLGHPRNATGETFFTSLHNRNAPGANVFCAVTNAHIGIVVTSQVTAYADVAEVRVLFGRVSAAGISNFRGIPRNLDRVRSIRGVTGTVSGHIVNASGNAPGFVQMILTNESNSAGGDSGAALIRIVDNAVLGVRQARCTLSGGGLYTRVDNYVR